MGRSRVRRGKGPPAGANAAKSSAPALQPGPCSQIRLHTRAGARRRALPARCGAGPARGLVCRWAQLTNLLRDRVHGCQRDPAARALRLDKGEGGVVRGLRLDRVVRLVRLLLRHPEQRHDGGLAALRRVRVALQVHVDLLERVSAPLPRSRLAIFGRVAVLRAKVGAAAAKGGRVHGSGKSRGAKIRAPRARGFRCGAGGAHDVRALPGEERGRCAEEVRGRPLRARRAQQPRGRSAHDVPRKRQQHGCNAF